MVLVQQKKGPSKGPSPTVDPGRGFYGAKLKPTIWMWINILLQTGTRQTVLSACIMKVHRWQTMHLRWLHFKPLHLFIISRRVSNSLFLLFNVGSEASLLVGILWHLSILKFNFIFGLFFPPMNIFLFHFIGEWSKMHYGYSVNYQQTIG